MLSVGVAGSATVKEVTYRGTVGWVGNVGFGVAGLRGAGAAFILQRRVLEGQVTRPPANTRRA
jgi:hypothetical protein